MRTTTTSSIVLTNALALILLLGAGCGGAQPCPRTPPGARGRFAGGAADVDREMVRLYGDPPAVGRLPGSIAWSPDGSRLAYLRRTSGGEGRPASELWIHEVAGNRQRPLLLGDRRSVSALAWADPDTIVISAEGALLAITTDGTRRSLAGAADRPVDDFAVSEDGGRAAFLRGHDLFAVDVATGDETRVTADGDRDRSFGTVSWVYGEEFRTERGFGLNADGSSMWFYLTDESATPRRPLVEDAAGSVREQAYPRAGETNPTVRVGVVDPRGEAGEPVWLDTGAGPDVYLPQVSWRPDGRLSVTRIDRLQTKVEILACDAANGNCEVLLEERDPRWINLVGPPSYFGEAGEYLWISERDGFAHIHRFDGAGRPKAALTSGRWTVNSISSIDEAAGAIYFTGNADDPLSTGVFRVGLDGRKLTRISPPGGVHEPTFCPNHERFVDVHSALGRIPRADVFRLEGKQTALEATLARSDLGSYRAEDVTDDIIEIAGAEGTSLLAQLTRPVHMEPGRRYPVVVYVYGGPIAQVVRDQFRVSFQPWRDLMARRGFLVFSVDGRGSGNRGREFEAWIHRTLGEVELEDQLAGVKYLESRPDVDPARIGIFGWSYGGTMVLNALLRTEGVFACGAAVAPVTDWREYDTAYTERYMQRPEDNPEGYERTALIPLAHRLAVPLLLAHGLADDNVHFVNTARLIDALVEAGKRFDLLVYPGRNHSIAGPEHRPHLFDAVTRFFERNL